MSKMASFFVKENELVPDIKYIVKGDKFRFSVLTPRLIRLEYNASGKFEDRATSLIVSRKFNDFEYTVEYGESAIKINTPYFNLIYAKDSPITDKTIKVTATKTNRVWTPNAKTIRNIGGLNYSLDNMDKLVLDNGLYSFDGFVAIDDSKNYVIDNDMFLDREKNQDIYLFVYNNDFGLCLQDYFNLTGYPSTIPRYSLGCWWYKNEPYNMDNIESTLKKFDDNNIPISVFLLGNKWHNQESCYTFDHSLFDTTKLLEFIKNKEPVFGISIDIANKIKESDPLYKELSQVLNNTKEGLSFIPIDNNKISIYLNNIINPIISYGFNLFNIEYNDIKNKNTLFLLNHYHYVIANLEKNNIILSRNPGIAPHRYPIIYSGKTKTGWDSLKNLAKYNNSAANMGVSWQTHAIGGYSGGTENPELFLRYLQFGVFNPIFLLASDGGKYYKREPWKWNPINLSVIEDYMNLRNKLVPYIYNEAYMYHKYGIPFIQPLYYKYPRIYDDPNYVYEYFFGSKFLISPIIKKKNIEMNRVVQRIFLPKGVWYDFMTGKKYLGNKYYTNFYRDENYPIFVKEGSIIPLSLDKNTNIPINMEIQVFPAENGLYGSYELYEDNNNEYLITKMNIDKIDNGYHFVVSPKEGNLKIESRNFLLRFRNMNKPNNVYVKCNDTQVPSTYKIEKTDLLVSVNNISSFNKLEVIITGDNIEIENLNLINEELEGILDDIEISTLIKEKIDKIIFSDLPINKKRIALRKLKKDKLEPKYINMFISLLEITEK